MRLMIKTQIKTGKKYLCVTKREDYHEYSGSGVYWNKHLDKHGREWTTEVLYESDDMIEFNAECKRVSDLLDVDKNPEFANLIPEYGYVGPIESIYENIALKLGVSASAARSITRKEYFALMSIDERRKYTEKFRKGLVNFLSNKTSEKYNNWINKISIAQKKVWKEKTDEDRKIFSEAVSKGRLNMSDEAKEKRAENIRKSFKTSVKRKSYMERVRSEGSPTAGTKSNFAKIVIWFGEEFTKLGFDKKCKDENLDDEYIEEMFSTRTDCTRLYEDEAFEECVCPHCGKRGTLSPSFKRWHFENCSTVKQRKILTCPHCDKIGDDTGGFRRWHMNNCKKKDKI